MKRQTFMIGRFLLTTLLIVAYPLGQLDAQSKLLSWLRERVGERASKAEKQASADAKWQKHHFKDKDAQKRFVAALKKSRCDTCHIKGKKKSICNPFGTELSRWLQAELKMETEEITSAMKTSAPEAVRQQVQSAFYKSLDKSLKARVKPKDKKSETFGERIKRGDLPTPSKQSNQASNR